MTDTRTPPGMGSSSAPRGRGGIPAVRERRRHRAEQVRVAIYEAAKVFVTDESGPAPPTPPSRHAGVERRLEVGDHVVLDRRNQNLVAGRTTHVSAMRNSVAYGLVVVAFGAAVIWIAGGPTGLLILLTGFAMTAMALVFELRRAKRFEGQGCLLTGEVTTVEETRGWTFVPYPGATVPSYLLRISYRFVTPTGEERRSEVRFTTEGYPVPSSGNRLAILYADRTKQRVM